MLFEIVEYSLNLWPASQELALAFGHDLFSLRVMRWRQDVCTERLSNLAVQWLASVPRIAHGDSGVLIDEHWYGPTVVDIGASEGERTESALVVDARVQLEAVVLTLPVVASVSDAAGDPVPATAHQFAHRKHGRIHEAERSFAL